MRRRLPAVFLAALLTFAVSACGEDSDDSDEPTNDDTTSQTEEPTDDATDGAEPTETDDTTEPPETDDGDGDDKGDSDDNKNNNKNKNDGGSNGNDEEGDGDDTGAIPDDLPSDNAADPDDLPIDAEVVIKTCEDVNPKDTWPSVDQVYFESDRQSVVATADVKVQGAKTAKTVCAVAGAKNNPQVMAYNAV